MSSAVRVLCFAVSLVIVAIPACTDRPDGLLTSLAHLDLGTPTTFRPGETLVVGAQTIGFAGVLSDSRCPSNAMCIAQGDAVARLVVGYLNDSILAPDLLLDLHTGSDGPHSGSALGYVVILLNLEPVPLAGVPTRPEDYRATIEVQPDTDRVAARLPSRP